MQIIEVQDSIARVQDGDKITSRKIYSPDDNPRISYKGEIFYISDMESANQPNKYEVPEFDINKRFEMLSNFTKMTLKGLVNSALITGEGGLGKSYTVLKELQEMNLVEHEDYVVIKGYSTPKALYATLYENANKIVIFDDCDSILKDAIALNILKGALDTYEKRTISWMSRGPFSDDLPDSFDFNGQVIFISNLKLNKIDQAVRSRAIAVDVSMNNNEKIQRIRSIISDILPEYDVKTKEEVLEFLEQNIHITRTFNIRTFQNVIKVHVQYNGKDWEEAAKYIMLNS
jgi:hypothetical protein